MFYPFNTSETSGKDPRIKLIKNYFLVNISFLNVKNPGEVQKNISPRFLI